MESQKSSNSQDNLQEDWRCQSQTLLQTCNNKRHLSAQKQTHESIEPKCKTPELDLHLKRQLIYNSKEARIYRGVRKLSINDGITG